MLIVSEKQISRMTGELRRLSARTVSATLKMRAPGWCRDKSEAEIDEFSAALSDLFLAHGIVQNASVVRLVELKIEYNYKIPLSEYESMMLSMKEFSEYYRIAKFSEYLKDNCEFIFLYSGE